MRNARHLALTAIAAAAIAAALAPAALAGTPATPIGPTGPVPSHPPYEGAPIQGKPFPGVSPAPQNPQMAPNPLSNVHNDTWMSDDYTQYAGPAGRHPKMFSTLT